MPEEPKKVKGPKNLSLGTIFLMVLVALLFDAIQAAFSWIGIGFVIIPIGYGYFWVWFKMHGYNFFSMKKPAGLIGGAAAEALTAGIAPGLTVSVVMAILNTKVPESSLLKSVK